MINYFKNILHKKQDNKYFKDFESIKYELCRFNPYVTKDDIDTFPLKIKKRKINSNELEIMNFYNKYILEELNSPISNGLCGFLSYLSIEVFSCILRERIAYLTIGRIKKDEKNIFSVPDKDKVINRFLNDAKEYNTILMGSNIHVWITLGNGIIIDPSILLTLDNNKNILVGTPNEIYQTKGFVFEPYFINDFKDVSNIFHNFEYYNENDIYKRLIKEKVSSLNKMPININGYY